MSNLIDVLGFVPVGECGCCGGFLFHVEGEVVDRCARCGHMRAVPMAPLRVAEQRMVNADRARWDDDVRF